MLYLKKNIYRSATAANLLLQLYTSLQVRESELLNFNVKKKTRYVWDCYKNEEP